MPPFFCWYYYMMVGNGNNKMFLMSVLTSIWGIRLTFNFARKGGYKWPPW